MGYLLCFLIFSSSVYSLISGTSQACSDAVTECGANALKLVITLGGGMAVWGGIVNLLNDSGLTEKLTYSLKILVSKIFNQLNKNGEALRAICLNLTANLFGLGNAATPLGIDAMRKIEKELGESETPPKSMTLFVVMNACSMQIIPTTVAAMRSAAGSASPMDILPCVLGVSAVSLAVAVTVAEVLELGR